MKAQQIFSVFFVTVIKHRAKVWKDDEMIIQGKEMSKTNETLVTSFKST